MAMIRWSPMLTRSRDLAGFRDEFDRMFDSFFRDSMGRTDLEPVFVPPVDIEETSDAFVLRADLPGASQKDVKVSILGDTLTIRGERRHEETKDQGHLHRTERSFGAFERSFTLGSAVRNDQIKASFKDGVLEVRVPKAEEARMREIEVQVG